jgi:hypothetical protein
VAGDEIQKHESSAGRDREAWHPPQVTRFDAAGAQAGDTSFSTADADTAKS